MGDDASPATPTSRGSWSALCASLLALCGGVSHWSGLRFAAEEGLPAGDPGARLTDATTAELAWGFQASVVDVLATKTIRAAEETGARSIVLGGGVAANAALRTRIAGEAEARNLPLIVPRPGLCTDNGAMIGAAAARRFAAGERAGLDLDARPSLPLARRDAAPVA